MNTPVIEIRTFASPKEISEHPEFVPDMKIFYAVSNAAADRFVEKSTNEGGCPNGMAG